MIRWGVVSTGRIAQQFAEDFSFVENGRIVAATSRTAGNARAYAHQYGIDTVYATYAELLADESIDAVYIASPHTLHLGQTLSAIEAGKAVLCEKPITVDPGQCERIIAAAADATPAPAAPDTTRNAEASEVFGRHLGTLTVTDASVAFTDSSVSPPFVLELRDLSVAAGGPDGPDGTTQLVTKIGRASCRERV